MPIAKKPSRQKTLKQDTLDVFLRSSSPPAPHSTSLDGGASATPSHRSYPTMKNSRAGSLKGRARVRTPVDDDASGSSDVDAIHFELTSSHSEDDDVEVESPRRPVPQNRKMRPTRADSDHELATSESSQEDISGVPVAWKGRNAGKKRKVVVEDSDEEELPRRKLIKGVRPPSPEEDDLLEEIDEDKIIEPRLRSRDKKSAFQRNLEKLKRKKRGEALVSESSSSEDEDEPDPFAHARPDVASKSTDAHKSGELEGDDENNFIVEDDNTEAPDLPVEFSMNTHQDLVHHFKIICQLFVHLAVHKVDDRGAVMNELLRKDYFSVPLNVTRRKLTGMRDSLVTSSVWRPDFKRPLETYPVFETIRLDFANPGCDACRLGGRLSTLLGRLSGPQYDKVTFETFEESDSSGSDESDDEEPKARVKKQFHLGRFCAARTRVFHNFTHWEYTLFEGLSREIDELRSSGTHGFVRVAYAGGKKPPEDLSDADGIMDWLDERGIINMEWQRMKEMMESARNLEMRAKKGEDDE